MTDELYNQAVSFDEKVSSCTQIVDGFSALQRYETENLRDLLENPYLSGGSKEIINMFFSGSIARHAYDEERENQSRKQNIYNGAVYLINSGEYYKIGKTKNLPSRMSVLAVGVRVPFNIQFVHSFQSADYSSAEAQLHAVFHDKRIEGEWFKLSKEDVSYIISIRDGQL